MAYLLYKAAPAAASTEADTHFTDMWLCVLLYR
jgi:hypothetical protein